MNGYVSWLIAAVLISIGISVVVDVYQDAPLHKQHQLRKIHIPGALDMARPGDTVAVYTTETDMHVEMYHSFRKPQCNEELMILQ